eukprot:snap_masked-scaffold295_size218279-processed-gene-1.19 protein:Tk09104 transcript:snap_masked-scaffold295_size218279-processed-gene-1.19-mRNA-1 annotation:"isopentenyl-diphosphate delta-isomerase i"
MSSTSSAGKVINPTQEKLLDEQCILVNEQDGVIGSASKRECHLLDKNRTSPLHRAFSLFIFNDKDELLLQQRSDEKITFPGLWTNTCCSHPLACPDEQDVSNEAIGVRRAAQRRVQAELGIEAQDCPVDDMVYLTRILYSAPSAGGQWGENEMDYILFLRRNELAFKPNPNEVKDVAFIRRQDLDDFIQERKAKNEEFTPWFSLLVRSFLPRGSTALRPVGGSKPN